MILIASWIGIVFYIIITLHIIFKWIKGSLEKYSFFYLFFSLGGLLQTLGAFLALVNINNLWLSSIVQYCHLIGALYLILYAGSIKISKIYIGVFIALFILIIITINALLLEKEGFNQLFLTSGNLIIICFTFALAHQFTIKNINSDLVTLLIAVLIHSSTTLIVILFHSYFTVKIEPISAFWFVNTLSYFIYLGLVYYSLWKSS